MTQQTILYIEDDDASRNLVRRVLTHAGYNVLVATCALEGLDLAQTHQPDLILTDINLPDMSGREITLRLRDNPRLKHVPVVALTAQSHSFERDKTFVAGVVGYLTKPVNIATLKERVKEYLDGRRDRVEDEEALGIAREAYYQELAARLEAYVRDLEHSNRELRRLDHIKDDFIQLTAHELRTPLTTVYGYSRLLQTSPLVQQIMAHDEDTRAVLSGLVESIERMNAVVSEIISVSRIASGRVDLKTRQVNLRQIMSEVLEEYGAIITQRHLVIDFDPEQWPTLYYADDALLEMAFGNLLGNAIKYTPDGGTIRLSAAYEARHLRICFEDSGIGIDPAEQPFIFDRFYTAGDTQLHSTSKTAFRGGGLGLGLSICRGIVEAHGGRISVESDGCDEERMPGSRFYIDLPADGVRPDQRHDVRATQL